MRQAMKRVDHLLRSAHRKRRDENPSATGSGFPNDLCQLGTCPFHRFVITIPICRFHDQCIGTIRRCRIPNDRQATAPNISGEYQPFRFPGFRAVEEHRGGAEYMARVYVGRANSWNDIERPVVRDAHH